MALLKVLRKIFVSLMIISFSLFEVSESVRICEARAEGEKKQPFQSESKLESSDYCSKGEGGNCKDSKDFKGKVVDKLTEDRWSSSIMMIVSSMVSIGAAWSCWGGVAKGEMNSACSWSAAMLAIGGVAYIAGEVALHIMTEKSVMDKLSYNKEDLDLWSQFCVEWNSHGSRSEAINSLKNGELNDLKPSVSDGMFEEAGEGGVYKFESYCDQVAVIQTQSAALTDVKEALAMKKTFTWTAIGSLGLGAGIELVQAIRGMVTWADSNSELGKLLACMEGINLENKAVKAQLVSTKSPTNLAILEKSCFTPIDLCVDSLKKTYDFHMIYGKKEKAKEKGPEPSSGLMCMANYTKFRSLHAPSEMACFYALSSCEQGQELLAPAEKQSYGTAMAAIQKSYTGCFEKWIKAEHSKAKVDHMLGGCSLGDNFDVSNFDDLKGDIESEISSAREEYENAVPEGVNNLEIGNGSAENLKSLMEKVNKSDKLSKEAQESLTSSLSTMMEYQKALDKFPKGGVVKAIKTARSGTEKKEQAKSKSKDACEMPCINGTENPIKKKAFNIPESRDEMYTQLKSLKSAIGFILPIANAANFSKDDSFKDSQWWTLLPLVVIITLFIFLSSFMRFYYLRSWHRLIWISVLIAIGTWNIINLEGTITELETQIGELDSMIGMLSTKLEVEAPTVETTGINQTVNENFENFSEVKYEDQNLGVKLPCPAGGDGRGKCKKVGKSIKASLAQLEINGIAGLSNSMEEMGDSLGGADTISASSLQAAGNIANAVGKIESARERLMKKLNDARAKEGLKAIRPDAEAKKIANSLKQAILNSKNPDIQAALKGNVVASAKPDIDKNEKELLEKLKARKKGGTEETGKKEDFMSGLNFNFEAKEPDNSIDFEMEDEVDKKMSDLDVKMDDVTKSGAANIFKVISTRYLKSAYPRLLEEKE